MSPRATSDQHLQGLSAVTSDIEVICLLLLRLATLLVFQEVPKWLIAGLGVLAQLWPRRTMERTWSSLTTYLGRLGRHSVMGKLRPPMLAQTARLT